MSDPRAGPLCSAALAFPYDRHKPSCFLPLLCYIVYISWRSAYTGPVSLCRYSPHPSRGQQRAACGAVQSGAVDTARAPRGDGNGAFAPSSKFKLQDATRTPRGDGNSIILLMTGSVLPRCNPHPSRGQQLNGVLVELLVVQMQPAPLRRLWKKRQEAMASCLFFPSWLSPTAGPTAT